MMHSRVALLLAGAVLGVGDVACGEGEFLSVKGERIVDPQGRHVILHGMNIGGKHRQTRYLSWHRPREFALMRDWGFNCVRLLVIWAALEPECGKYDEAYLRQIDRRIEWAKANGLYVVVDMHQDLWGETIPGGDGAPAWATLDEGKPHVHTGPVWSDAYMTSPKVHAVFDSFWANKPGSDGVGIQDRFALAWQHVARRYAEEPAVAGYDLFNEPFPGSPILLAQMMMGRALLKLLGTENPASGPADLVKLFGDEAVQRKLEDITVYTPFIDASEGVFKLFERTQLGPMYARVAKAIREVDKRHILFIEPSVSVNRGVVSDVQAVAGTDGKPDPLQALAPHAYDIVTDAPGAGPASEARMKLILGRVQDLGKRMKLPMFLGEWGSFHGEAHAVPVTRQVVRMLEESLAGDAYWYFDMGIEQRPYFEMLNRPYPAAVAGTIVRYEFDPASGRFSCEWKEDGTVTAPSRIYLPARWYPKGYEVTVQPVGIVTQFEPVKGDKASGYLVIPPTGQAPARRLEVRAKGE